MKLNLRILQIAGLVCLLGIGAVGIGHLAGAADDTGTYNVDAAHSMIIFRAKHNNVAYNYGRFNEFTGELTIAEDASESAVSFEVKAGSIDTGNEKRDQHLRSSDFFSAKQFPVITFKSTAVKMKADAEDVLEVTGDLELHGVKKSITVDVEITGRGEGREGEALIGFETTFTIQRSDFGMTYGMGPVSDDIRITVSIEAARK